MADIIVDVTSPTLALSTNVSIPGPQGPRGAGSNINDLNLEFIYITGKDGIIVSSNNFDIIYVSGNSGYFQSAVNSLTNNLNSTGSNLDNKITSLSGALTSTYATITNLASTGSTLLSSISSLNSAFTGYTGTLDTTYASDTQLANTGSTLDTKINFLSGVLTGNYLTTSSASSTYATITNLASTGSTLLSSISSLNSAFTGYTGTLDATYASDTQLANTGSTLISLINSLSGTSTGNYVTKTNGQFTNRPTVNGTGVLLSGEVAALPNTIVYTTGDQVITGVKTFVDDVNLEGITTIQNLNLLTSDYYFEEVNIEIINSSVRVSGDIYVSGNKVLTGVDLSSYATKTNLASTGSTLDTKINSLSGVLTGNYLTTSSASSTYATITNLASTGSTLLSSISFLNSAFTGYTGTLDATYASDTQLANTGSTLDTKINNLSGVSVLTFGNQTITGNKIFNSLRIEPSGRAFNIGTGLNINSESGIVRINTNVSSSLGAGFTYALTSGMDPNRPLDIEGRGRLVHGLSLDAGSANFTNASDHFHLFFSAGPSNPGSFNGRYSTDTNTNYKSYQFSPTTRPNGNENLRDLIHLTTLEAKNAGDQTFPTSNLTELYLTTTGTTVVTPPGTGLVELAYAINSQVTSQYLHSTGDTVYLRVFPGVAGIVANTYNGTVVTRATGLDPTYGSTNVYKVGIALGALGINNNFNSAQRGTSTQTDAWTLTRSAPSNAFTGITRIERNSSQYLDQFNVFYTSPITGYTGESVVVDVFNRGTGTFIASGITLTQARYDGYISKVLSSTGLEITLSVMNFGSLGGVGRPGTFHNPPLTTGSAFISSEDLITGMKILRGSSDSVHRNYWAHNVFAGFRNLDATNLNVPAGVITRVAVGGLNRVESESTSALGFNNKAYGFNSHAYGAHQENYNRDSVRIGATNESYINIVSGRLGVNIVRPSATIDIGTGNIIAGGLLISGNPVLTGVDLSNIVFTTGNQTISGVKTFVENTTFGDSAQGDFLVISGNNFTVYGSGNFTSGLFVNGNAVLTGVSGSSVLLYGNQNISGNKTFINNLEVQGTGIFNALDLSNISEFNFSGTNINLINGNVNISGQIYISGNPVLTGVNLSSYATVINLASTGSTLDTKINSLSGVLTGNYLTTSSASSTYATITNLASTGSTLLSSIRSLNSTFTGYTGTLDAIYASDIQLANTGSTLNTKINNLSGYINSTGSNIVFTTGDQNISGNKTFIDNINVSGTGYFQNINISSLSELILSGAKIIISGNSGVYSSTDIYINGNPVLTGVNLTSYLASSTASSTYATITNLASTGSTLDTKINTLSGVSVLRFGDQTISGLKTFTNTGTFNSGINLNNSNLINASPQIINLSSNFNISGNYNSRMIMVNSATEVTGRIVSGNSLGFNATIMQVGSGQVLITGSGIGINIGSYNNQYKTAGKFAAVSVLHTGSNGYTIYGNTAV